jgi:hypothetical protein
MLFQFWLEVKKIADIFCCCVTHPYKDNPVIIILPNLCPGACHAPYYAWIKLPGFPNAQVSDTTGDAIKN